MQIKKILLWLMFYGFSLGAIWFFTSEPFLPESQVSAPEPWLPQSIRESDQLLLKDSLYLLKEKQAGTSSATQNAQDVKIQLLGIVEESGHSVAIVTLDKENFRFMAGDSLPDGSVLDAIAESAVMIISDDTVVVVPLYQKGKEKK